MADPSRRRTLALVAIACAGSLLAQAASAEEEPSSKPAYIALGDFTVNLPGGEDAASSYVVVGVTVDAAPQAANELRDMMPRLKEAIIRRLMKLADRGVLQPGRTDPLMLKTSLLDCLAPLRPDGVREVLIVRLLYG